jgi:UDP-N-acetylmuramoyl-tripeptide--D-alanyl-D-alanine ligase
MIAESASQAGMPASAVVWVPTVPEAIEVLSKELREGDVVLIKGSRGMHMERIVAALEANL